MFRRACLPTARELETRGLRVNVGLGHTERPCQNGRGEGKGGKRRGEGERGKGKNRQREKKSQERKEQGPF